MGFCRETIDRWEAKQERESQYICTEGWHVVQIDGWRYDPPGTRRSVIFDLRDALGRGTTARFSLSIPVLRGGVLLRFVAAAMKWRLVEHQGRGLQMGNSKNLKELIGRDIAVFMQRNNRGYYDVVDWSSTQPESPG